MTALLAGRVVPTATATRWVSEADYLTVIGERDATEGLLAAAEARIAELEARLAEPAQAQAGATAPTAAPSTVQFIGINAADSAPDFFNLAHVAAATFTPGRGDVPPTVHLAFTSDLAAADGDYTRRDLRLELSLARWEQLRVALAARSL